VAAAGIRGKRERGKRGFHPRPHLGPRWREGACPRRAVGGGRAAGGGGARGLGRGRAVARAVVVAGSCAKVLFIGRGRWWRGGRDGGRCEAPLMALRPLVRVATRRAARAWASRRRRARGGGAVRAQGAGASGEGGLRQRRASQHAARPLVGEACACAHDAARRGPGVGCG
jgi:hypothetical protein